jgi:hypothetical protein
MSRLGNPGIGKSTGRPNFSRIASAASKNGFKMKSATPAIPFIMSAMVKLNLLVHHPTNNI